MSGTVRRR